MSGPRGVGGRRANVREFRHVHACFVTCTRSSRRAPRPSRHYRAARCMRSWRFAESGVPEALLRRYTGCREGRRQQPPEEPCHHSAPVILNDECHRPADHLVGLSHATAAAEEDLERS